MEVKKEKLVFADLHIHSKYSRACSKDLDIKNLVKWAKIKGLGLLGTGDFTHPKWIEEIKGLREDDGIYYSKSEDGKEFPFILSSEISLIYSKEGKGRRVHLLYLAPDLIAVEKINKYLDSKGRRDYDGRPIFGISCRDFASKMEELDKRIEVIPAHIWTPWFGLFGSKGGFDSIKEAFEDKSHLIHAIETGISSDPEMNWKIKDLNDIAIVSFSDAHSFWPWRLGREATIFHMPENGKLSYDEIIRQIREKDFFGTIETDPAYGKYHLDGHRDCNFSSDYIATKNLGGICPVCKKPLTIGVEYRVNELGNLGKPDHLKKKFFYKVLPLHEIISIAISVGVNSKATWKIFNELMERFNDELEVLFFAKREEISKVLKNDFLTDLIILNREGKIEVKPGYDGLYGKLVVGGKEIAVGDDDKDKGKDKDDETKGSMDINKIKENINPKKDQLNQKIVVQKKLF